jgi:hypothetical protein
MQQYTALIAAVCVVALAALFVYLALRRSIKVRRARMVFFDRIEISVEQFETEDRAEPRTDGKPQN